MASIITDDEDEKEAEGRTFEDWPHLAMKSVGEMELMRLWGVLRGDPSQMDATSGEALVHRSEEDGGMVVSRVRPELVAALPRPDVPRIGAYWQACEEMSEWPPEAVVDLLQEMAEFTNRAVREGKPVLQLWVW